MGIVSHKSLCFAKKINLMLTIFSEFGAVESVGLGTRALLQLAKKLCSWDHTWFIKFKASFLQSNRRNHSQPKFITFSKRNCILISNFKSNLKYSTTGICYPSNPKHKIV